MLCTHVGTYCTIILVLVLVDISSSSSSSNNVNNNNVNNIDINMIGSNDDDNLLMRGQFGGGSFCNLTRGIHSNLIRMITKEGFHRELNDKFEITVTNSPLPVGSESECVFNVLYKFGVDVYIDPYEPVDQRQARTMIILNNWTDLENPAWLAKSNSTLLVQPKKIMTGNLLTTDEIKIPIHFRYQKPLRKPGRRVRGGSTGLFNTGGYTEVQVPLPRLLIRCNNWSNNNNQNNNIDEKKAFTAATSATSTTGGGFDCPIVKTLCSPTHSKDEICQWISVPFKSNSKGSSVYIPVGDADSTALVTFLTLLVILGGTLFILHSLSRANKEIASILLLQQQQLQNKPKVD